MTEAQARQLVERDKNDRDHWHSELVKAEIAFADAVAMQNLEGIVANKAYKQDCEFQRDNVYQKFDLAFPEYARRKNDLQLDSKKIEPLRTSRNPLDIQNYDREKARIDNEFQQLTMEFEASPQNFTFDAI